MKQTPNLPKVITLPRAQVPVHTLNSSLLDYLVARADGWTFEKSDVLGIWNAYKGGESMLCTGRATPFELLKENLGYHPCTDWKEGGRLIARYDISIQSNYGGTQIARMRLGKHRQQCSYVEENYDDFGKLVAAMRSLVESRFGLVATLDF